MKNAGNQALAWLVPPIVVCAGMAGLELAWIPRGVPGEWTWTAPIHGLSVKEWSCALITVVGYLTYLLIALKLLKQSRLIGPIIVSLLPAAALVQVGLQLAAPYGYGLAKWTICSYVPACSGYFTVAKAEASDFSQFLAKYPEWIKSQDALHIGTHPPGLIVEARAWLHFWEQRPELARIVVAKMPSELREAARNVVGKEGMSAADLASVISISVTHWAFCSLTVWALFILVSRLGYDAYTAFLVAAFWPVLPAVVMFQPASDIAFAPIATLAFALVLPKTDRETVRASSFFSCGLILAFGMFFSLVFLGVGLVVAVLIALNSETIWKYKCRSILIIGAGFTAGTMAWAWWAGTNPLLIWNTNQVNHARFYVEFPRSYGKWLAADVAETGFGIGLPIFTALVLSLIATISQNGLQTKALPALITFCVLTFLAISGRSLSEVARLWVPFYPALISALAAPISINRSIPLAGWWVIWVMIQLIWLQTMLQLVYPI